MLYECWSNWFHVKRTEMIWNTKKEKNKQANKRPIDRKLHSIKTESNSVCSFNYEQTVPANRSIGRSVSRCVCICQLDEWNCANSYEQRKLRYKMLYFIYLSLATICLQQSVLNVNALDNGLALKPPMGWMSWQRYRCITDCDKYPDECIRFVCGFFFVLINTFSP